MASFPCVKLKGEVVHFLDRTPIFDWYVVQ
jgi:hypothetical protein